VLVAGVAVVEVNEKQLLEPVMTVIVDDTTRPVLNEKPEGAFRMKVPLPGKSLCAPSAIVGPVSVVHVAVPFVVLVSALMALPPVAVVTVTAANALFAPANNAATKITKTIPRILCESFFMFIKKIAPARMRVQKTSKDAFNARISSFVLLLANYASEPATQAFCIRDESRLERNCFNFLYTPKVYHMATGRTGVNAHLLCPHQDLNPSRNAQDGLWDPLLTMGSEMKMKIHFHFHRANPAIKSLFYRLAAN